MKKLKALTLGKVEDQVSFFLIGQTVFIMLFVLQIWIEAFYRGESFEAKIGWLAEDGGGNTYESGIGRHYFSDYSSMIESSGEKNPWQSANNYPPFAMFLFKLFSFLPSQVGLITWLLLSAVLLLAPLLFVSKHSFSLEQRLMILLVYVISAPFLATLDRGNQIAALPILFILFYIAVHSNSNLSAGIFLGLAVSIKIYPIILVIYLIRIRQWATIMWTLTIFFVLTVFSSFFFSSSLNSVYESFRGISSHNNLASEPQPMVFSAAGILHNLSHLIAGPDSQLTAWINGNDLTIGLLILILVVLISVNKFSNFSLLPYLYCLQLIPTQSYTYTRIWSFVALVILLRSPASRLKSIWLLIVGLNLSPFVVWFQNEVNLFPTLSFFIFLTLLVIQIFNQIDLKKWFKQRIVHGNN